MSPFSSRRLSLGAGFSGFLCLALALAAPAARGQEPISIESIATRYFAAQSYCDAGKIGWRDDAKLPYVEVFAFERCARRDGRFEYVQHHEQAGETVLWSDARKYYRYLEHGRRYQELPLRDAYLADWYRNAPDIYPVFVFELFSSEPRRLADPAERARYLQSYALNASLSSADVSVFERSGAERLWVLNAARSIIRHERLREGGVVQFVEIASQSLDRPLSDADLWYDAPFSARYSAANNLPAFVAALLVGATLAGGIVWGWAFARARSFERVLSARRLLWRAQLAFFGVMAPLLGALAAFAPGRGHSPLIAYVYAIGVWSAVAFGALACFTLASYPVERWLKRA